MTGCTRRASNSAKRHSLGRVVPLTVRNLRNLSGTKNHAFGKPCLCPRDTRHFCRFHGVWAALPLLYWVERKFVIFAILLFLQLISPKSTFQYKTKTLSEITFPKVALHVFVCDSENYMERNVLALYCWNTHFNYIKECFRNEIRNVSDWSTVRMKLAPLAKCVVVLSRLGIMVATLSSSGAPFVLDPLLLFDCVSVGAPNLGSAEGGHPDWFRFLPICFDLRSWFSGIPPCVPICSGLLHFFRSVRCRTNQNKSGKPLSADPFCKSLILVASIDTHIAKLQARWFRALIFLRVFSSTNRETPPPQKTYNKGNHRVVHLSPSPKNKGQ